MERLKRIISILLVFIMSVVSIGANAPIHVDAETEKITIYFMDATAEGWIANDSAVMELVDNTNGQARYTMTTDDNKLWSAEVPASANNITFNRYDKGKTELWNSWSAGGRDGKVTYQAEGTSNGRWTEEQFTQEEITVYFYNQKGWSNPYLYYYSGSNAPKAWPGVRMEAVEGEEGWYSYTIKNRKEARVIFSNNGGEQIPGKNEEGFLVSQTMWYKDGQWFYKKPNDITIHFCKPSHWDKAFLYSYKTSQETQAAWPGVSMTKEDDEWYSYTIKEWNEANIIFNDGSNEQIPGKNEKGFTVTGEKWYKDGVFFDEKPQDIIVHFRKPENWNAPNLYYYKSGQETGPAWPGQKMQEEYKDWYSYRIPNYIKARVVFNDGTQQIPNRMEDGFEVTKEAWYQDGEWYEENPDPYSYSDEENTELTEDTIPEFMDVDKLLENGHISRLNNQEPDDSSIVFRNEDGSKSMYLYDQPVKYTDENGDTQDKTNQLTNRISDTTYVKDYAYVNPNNDIQAYFPKTMEEDTGVVLTYEDNVIKMSPVTEESAAVKKVKVETGEDKKQDAVEYETIFGEATTVRYAAEFNGFKEDIILEQNTGVNEFSYTLKTNGLRLYEWEGSYILMNPETEEDVFALGEILVYDSKETEEALAESNSYNHSYRIKTIKEDMEYLVTIVVDQEYLNSKDTVYPVTVDPSTIKITYSGIEDATLFQDSNGVGKTSGSIHVGNYEKAYPNATTRHKKARTLVRFPGLFSNSTINRLEAKEIVSVLYVPRDLMCYSTTTTINCYRATKKWEEAKVSYSAAMWDAYDNTKLDGKAVQWNNGTQSTGIHDTKKTNNQYYPFDITKAVRDWVNDSYGGKDSHYGILLKAANEDNKAITFASSRSAQYRPSVLLTWNEPTKVTITSKDTNVDLDDRLQLTAEVAPSEASQRIKWSSGNKAIATVNSDGKVTGKKQERLP